MQEHNGMRPQDIIVLIKLALEPQKDYTLQELSRGLGVSSSEISKSIQRSQFSGLISSGRKVAREALFQFLKYGLPYAFPTKPGSPVRGIPTAISHPQIREHFRTDDWLVWPHASGTERGFTVTPLHPTLADVVTSDSLLYFAMALVDVLRIGKAREKRYAEEALKKLLSI
jgi:hypothetical protein